jgi:AcrR family transcriptional regulator
MRGVASTGVRTREHLLDVAEQLLGTEGVGRVSMRQIRIAAGQRNEGAVQYHFGDRNGVIKALAERHSPRVQEIQERIVATHGTRPSLRQLVDAMTRPMAEYCTYGPSERAWTKILADLITDPTLGFATLQEGSPPLAARIGTSVYERLATTLTPQLAGDRVWAVTQFTIHVTADRSRLSDDPNAARRLTPDDVFIDNVVTMAYGALTAKP